MRPVLILLFSSIVLFAETPGQPVWQPEKTWVFAVGVIQYDDPSRTSWPDQGRVDAKMIEAFRKRGVPEKQIVFLKNKEGTRANIMQKLPAFAKQAGADDTLIFYYAGHGSRDYSKPERTHTFVTYDTKSRWTVSSVVDTIAKNFRGARVILTADCCHSGSLGVEAQHEKLMPASGILTSARATSTSTGNWTFTQCLVDMLEGNPALDFDHDGSITFREAAAYTDAEMAFTEDQRADTATTGKFSTALVMAQAKGKLTSRVGERCEGNDRGKWYKAKIIAEKDGKFLVTWPGWSKSEDAWLTPDRLRPYTPELIPLGTPMEIQWNGKWYPGSVVKTENGLHLVHYDGYPDSDDEWVIKSRLRAPKAAGK